MATFIPYQPRAKVLPLGTSTFSKSPTVIGSSTLASSRQSSKSQVETASMGKADFVDFVDLTASHPDPPQECLVLRELLGPMCDDPNDRSIRIARDRSSGTTCNDKVKPGKGADKDDDDMDYESDISDLPSLREIFRQNETPFGTRNNLSPKVVSSPAPVDRTSADEDDRKEIAYSNAGTISSVQAGASQDNPIMLDDDQPVDMYHDGTILDGERRTREAADPAYAGDRSPELPRGCVDPATNQGKNTAEYSAKYNTDNRTGQEQEGVELHKDDAVHTHTPARGSGGHERSGSGSGSGINSDAPASIGRIHDIFAEYEETFGLSKSKHKAARSVLHGNPESETTAAFIPRGIIRGEPRVAADDGVTDAEQAAEAARDDAAHLSKRGIEDGPTFRSRMEISAQDTEIVGASSKGDPTLTGNYHPENISPFPQHPLPSPPMTPEAIKSDPDVAIQGTRTRKRSWSSTESTTGLDVGPAVKRSGRPTKETWKAREAREAREAAETKQARTSSVPYRKDKARSVCLGSPLSDFGKVADIEDVYLAEDGSIQCLVSWKSSLIAMENLVGGELRRRCEELFGKRYGHWELHRRATIRRQTKK